MYALWWKSKWIRKVQYLISDVINPISILWSKFPFEKGQCNILLFVRMLVFSTGTNQSLSSSNQQQNTKDISNIPRPLWLRLDVDSFTKRPAEYLTSVSFLTNTAVLFNNLTLLLINDMSELSEAASKTAYIVL